MADDHKAAGSRRDLEQENTELKTALKETVVNLESLVERAERVLSRARERLAQLDLDRPDP